VYCSSRHIPGVRFAGITHPGLIGTAPSQELLDIWNEREGGLVATGELELALTKCLQTRPLGALRPPACGRPRCGRPRCGRPRCDRTRCDRTRYRDKTAVGRRSPGHRNQP